jgi:hypothetical protein
MANNNFLNNQNLKLLWDILLDELRVDKNNKSAVTNIRIVFESNINLFSKNANANKSLIDLNKQFLSQVLIAVNRLFPNLNQPQGQGQDLKRIQISSEELSEPYKIEDIRESRQDTFEKQLQQKRQDFDNSMNQYKPKELDFTEKIEDGKIKEMDALIAETVARRKFDIEQITLTNNTSTNTLPNNNNNIIEDISELSIYRKLKLKQPDSSQTSMPMPMPMPIKKNVSWDNELEQQQPKQISLVIEEIPPNKVDILIDKVDILINLMTKLTNTLFQQEKQKQNEE